MTCRLLQILMLSSFHLIYLSSQQEIKFIYDNFHKQENLYLDGSATVLPSGLLQLTNAGDHQMAHVFYKKLVKLSPSQPLSILNTLRLHSGA